jgi:hypothetical protein
MAKKKNKENSESRIVFGITVGVLAVLIIVYIIVGNKGSSSSSNSVVSNSGSSSSSNSVVSNSDSSKAVVATIEGNSQTVEINVLSGSYTPIIVQKGIPVKFNLKVDESNLSGCNSRIRIDKYGITKTLKVGDNIVEFTPTETGTFEYTCYMGMISSSITVVDDLNNIDPNTQNNISAAQKSGSCGCGGGN